jgi:hypothetical protein
LVELALAAAAAGGSSSFHRGGGQEGGWGSGRPAVGGVGSGRVETLLLRRRVKGARAFERRGASVVHLRTSLVQLFVLLL